MKTPPMFWVEPAWLDAATPGAAARLTGPQGHHAATVRRIRVGEVIRLSAGDGRMAEAEVVESVPGELGLLVLSCAEAPVPQPSFVLVQALAKGGRDEQAIEACTELGVERIVPWAARNCVVEWNAAKAPKALAKWQKVVDAAAKQARQVRVPEVSPLRSSAALTAEVAQVVAAGGLVLIGDGRGEALRPDSDLVERARSAAQVWCVVGPEGGISEAEIAALVDAGARLVSCGTSVLRSAHAGPAMLAVLASWLRW